MLQGRYKDATRMLQVLQGCYMDVTRTLEGFDEDVTTVLQGC
jgi:hypothetical protein